MKRIILAALLLIAFQQYATAQTDTIWEKSSHWHISEWSTPYWSPNDTCQVSFGRCYSPVYLYSISYYVEDDFAKEQFSSDSIAVTGIAVMVSMNRHHIDPICDPLFTPGSPKKPEHVMLAKYDSVNNDMILFSDSLRWDTASPKVMWAKLCPDSSDCECCWHDIYVYEAFFPKGPVIADSSFFILATAKSNYWAREPGYQWHPYEPTLYVGIEGPGHPRNVRMREFTKSTIDSIWQLNRSWISDEYHGQYHGGFFPIVDLFNLEARPEESCDSMGTVTGSGRFSGYVPRRITAVRAPGYWFRHWNDGNTDNPRTVILTQDTLFTATFTEAMPCRADALTQNSTHGTTTGSGNYFQGDTVTFTALPNTGYALTSWSNGSTQNPYHFVITHDTTLTARFRELGFYHVDVATSDHSRGYVTGGGNYWELETARINAAARQGYRFSHWNDGNTSNPRHVIVTQDTAFTAYFEWIDQHEGINAPDAKKPLFTLTPNPAHNSVTVTVNTQLPILKSQLSITLTDAAGRELLNTKVSTPNFQLPISQYPAGTYFVTLRTPDTSSTQRLVIE